MTLVAYDDEEVSLALRAQLEAVAEVPPPVDRFWNNIGGEPDVLRPHLEADFLPGKPDVTTTPAEGGHIDAIGQLVVRYYGLQKTGESAIWAVVRGIKAAFRPATSIALPSGNTLRIRARPAPYSGQILPTKNNKAVCTITITWESQALNVAPV